MFKAPLTAFVVANFISSYQSFASPSPYQSTEPFVYVDHNGVKLVTNVLDEKNDGGEGVFALSMAQDGWVEMLALHEQTDS